MTFDDDFPEGFTGEGNWGAVEFHCRLFERNWRGGFTGTKPGRKGNKSKERYKTEEWKEKHRKHARESARRRRALKKAA